MPTQDEIARINELRYRIVNGEDISIEETKEAIQLLRARRPADTAGKGSGKEQKVPMNLNDLFDKPVEGGK